VEAGIAHSSNRLGPGLGVRAADVELCASAGKGTRGEGISTQASDERHNSREIAGIVCIRGSGGDRDGVVW